VQSLCIFDPNTTHRGLKLQGPPLRLKLAMSVDLLLSKAKLSGWGRLKHWKLTDLNIRDQQP
jgi:hypothetical protein